MSAPSTYSTSVLADLSPAELDAVRTIAQHVRPHLQAAVAADAKPLEPIWDFAHRNFYIPETRSTIKLLPHQLVILRLMFEWALDKLRCQTFIYSTVKKSGKTAIGSLIARYITERFGSHAEVYCVANDLEQSTYRTFKKVVESVELDPNYDHGKRELPGKWHITDRQAIYLPTKSMLRPVSSDYRGEAGSNPVASVWSELWGFKQESARRLWDELTPVPTRPRSLRLVETYAGYIGESELLWDVYELSTHAKRGARRLTLDDVPNWPFPEDDRSNGGPGLPLFVNIDAGVFAYWDEGERARRMPWQTPLYYQRQAAGLRPAAFDRLHKNEWTSAVSSFIPMEWWDAIGPPAKPAVPLPLPGSDIPVVIAADASVSGDCTGVTMHRRDPNDDSKTAIVASQVWVPDNGRPLNYSYTIEPALRRWITGHIHPLREDCTTHSSLDALGACIPTEPYNVVQVAYDAYQLHDMMTRFRNEGLAWTRPFSQNAERMVADKGLYDDIRDRRITHHGDPTMRDHVGNAAAKQSKDEDTKLRIVKKSSASKVDLIVCASMGTAECKRLLI